MPKSSEINEPPSSKIIDKSHFKGTEPENINTIPSTYLLNLKVANENCCPDNNQITPYFMTQLSANNLQICVKAT